MLTLPNGEQTFIQTLDPRPEAIVRFPSSLGKARGRVYLCHGITTNPAAGFGPLGGNQFQLTLDLVADGWECILVPYPEDFQPNDFPPAFTDLRDDIGHGTRWLNTTLASFDNLDNRVTALYGWMPRMIIGGSWGGWHALQLAAHRNPIAWSSHVPVTVVGNATGIAPPGLTLVGTVINYPFDTSGADCFAGMLNSLTMPGYLRAATESTHWGPQVTDPYITSQIGQSALNAGVPLATRTITDGVVTGGTTLTTTQAAFIANGAVQIENGSKITAPGQPAGTTISGISGSSPGPWTCTLSQPWANGSYASINFPNLIPSIDESHQYSAADIAATFAWVQATVNPNYPVAF